MKNTITAVLAILILSSCEKEIQLDLNNESGKIVIEANLTNTAVPETVRITRSVTFTAANQYPAVTNALVVIKDDAGNTDTLQYQSNGTYTGTKIVPVPGKTYHLTVQAEGVTYTAQSTMPQQVALDALQADSISFAGNVRYTVLPQFTDPSFLGNRYLFITTAIGKPGKIMEVFSDNINNGLANQRSIMLVYNSGDEEIKAGDTVKVEMQAVDEAVYTYYAALLQLSGNGAGGGATPANPPGNISNNALGYFSAHSTASKTIILQ